MLSMTVSECLRSASNAVSERLSLLSRMEWRRLSLGIHGRSGGQIPRGTSLDPMRQVDEALDAEADDDRLLSSFESEIADACRLIAGIDEMASREAAEVIERRMLLLEQWEVIATKMRHTVAACEALLSMTLEWADGIGIARLSDAARQEEADAMLRRVLAAGR